jgi:hypothetical protein
MLEVDGVTQEIASKTLSDASAIKSMAGKNVDVEYSDGAKPFVVSITTVAAASVKAPGKTAALAHAAQMFGVLCYLPPADMINLATIGVHQSVLAQNMIKEGLISKKLGDKIMAKKLQ